MSSTPPAAAQLLVRTITAFLNLSDAAQDEDAISSALRICARVAAAISVPVQTIRLVLRTPGPTPHALTALLSCDASVAATPASDATPAATHDAVIERILTLESLIEKHRNALCLGLPVMLSVGAVSCPGEVPLALSVVTRTHATITCILPSIQDAFTVAIAACVRDISTHDAFGNFRFGATSCGVEYTPFFPAAYAWGSGDMPVTIAIGFEHVRLCIAAATRACEAATGAAREVKLDSIRDALMCDLNAGLGRVVDAAAACLASLPDTVVSHTVHVDTSLAPTPEPAASLEHVFKLAGVSSFGAAGTLEVCSMLTSVFKGITLPPGAVLSGYCGLMLAPMEDAGLAANAGRYNVAALLSYSAVCGVGLDTVPIPGNTSLQAINGIIRDVAALALRLRKPLSVRLFPVPGCAAGDATSFDSPYMCNTSVFGVE